MRESRPVARKQVIGAIIACEDIFLKYRSNALRFDFGGKVRQVIGELSVVAQVLQEASWGTEILDD